MLYAVVAINRTHLLEIVAVVRWMLQGTLRLRNLFLSAMDGERRCGRREHESDGIDPSEIALSILDHSYDFLRVSLSALDRSVVKLYFE